jgi:hypothetical protein
VGGGLPCGARITNNGTDTLLIQQISVPAVKIASAASEGTQHNYHLSSFLPGLIDGRRVSRIIPR